MEIYIDSHEREIIPRFEQYVETIKNPVVTGVKVGTYKAGDYHSGDGNVGIERKKDDLVPSIYEGLLDKQMNELSINFKHPFLFLEYDGWSDLLMNNFGADYKLFIGEFSSIMARHNVSIYFTSSFFIPCVVKLMEKFYDGKKEEKLLEYTPVRQAVTTKDKQKAIVADLVGPVLGNRLLKQFGTIKNIANAEPEELEKVRGVGEKSIDRIKEILG